MTGVQTCALPICQLEGEELKFSGKYGGTSTPCSFYFSIASPWRVLFMLLIDNVKPSNNDEISQLMRPTYPRSIKLDDLIVVSGIHWVIEKRRIKITVNYSGIKNALYTLLNVDSEKPPKTQIRVHLSTFPEAEWSVVCTSNFSHMSCGLTDSTHGVKQE